MNARKSLVSLAIVGLAAVPLAACSSGSDSGSESTSSTAASSSASSAAPTTTEMPKPAAEVPALTGRDTSVKLDQGFSDALTSLGLTPGTIGTATLADGSVTFPITSGNVTYYTPDSGVNPYVQGDIKHDGSGLSLTAGDTVVELNNFDIDPGTSVLRGDVYANGMLAAPKALLFNLDGSTLQPLSTNPDGTAVLQGTRVLMSQDAATLLNQTFKTDAVKEGLVVGVATITVNTQ